MNTLEITLQRKIEGKWSVVVGRSASGSALPMRSEGELALNVEELQIALRDPKAYGQLLGQGLFRDGVRDAFVQARSEAEETVRVLLDVEDEALRGLRWERLCAPFDGKWEFLALNQRAPLSLYLPSLTDRRFPPIGRRDLKALVMVASPTGLDKYGLGAFDGGAAARSVRTALGEIPSDLLADGEGTVGQPTLDALCERITAHSYSLLHLVCHGKFQSDGGDTILYLAGPGGAVAPVTATTFIDRLSKLQGARGLPHFTFLCTCESAVAEAEGALGGLGQRLVRELGMPAVVAMTEKMSVLTAEALASAFYQQLRQHGEVDRALVEATAGLQGRYDVTVPALFSRLGGRPLFSDTLDRELTQDEIKFGLERFEALLNERAPILRSQFEAIANTLRSTLSSEVQALSKQSREDRTKALTELAHLCEETTDLNFAALAQGQPPATYDSRRPFRGLYPFKAEDREFFCGREQLIQRLVERVAEHNLLAVLGPSGSGKSSVVMAGLIPVLQAKHPDLSIGYLTPTAAPLGQLEAALTKLSSSNNLLIVDQFEELFTLCSDQAQRKRFIDQLLALPEKMQVVITMRADFWGECASYPTLKEAMLAHQELIGPMDTVELRRGMEEQARKVGLRFEADLSNTILDDVQGEPGAMPLLQHALLELWKRRHGRWLRADEYRAIGGDQAKASGVRGAIARTADDVYQQLAKAEQDIVREIFVRLTRLDESAVQGVEQRDTRRRAKLEELVPAGGAGDATKRLVSQLADARLVVTSRNAVTGLDEVEVAHEALIRYWPRLRAWLDEDRVALRLREGISEAAAEWRQRPKDQDLLIHKGARLEEIEKLLVQGRLTLNDQERHYITACQAQRGVQERRRKSVVASLASLAIIAVIAAIGAITYARIANKTIAAARGFTDDLMFEIVDDLRKIEKTQDIRSNLLAKVGDLHDKLGQVVPGEDHSTKFWRSILEGDIELETPRPDRGRAREKYENSVSIADPLKKDPDWERNLSVSYGKLGDLELSAEDFKAARDWFKKSLDIDKRLADQSKENKILQRDLFISYQRLGSLEERDNRPGEARKMYEESRKIIEHLAKEPKDAKAQHDYWDSSVRLGDVAFAAAHRSKEIVTRLAEDPKDAKASHNLEAAQKQYDEDIHEARKRYAESKEIAERLAKEHPHDTQVRRDLVISLISLGNVEIETAKTYEDPDAKHALGLYAQAQSDIDEGLVEDDLGDERLQENLCILYGTLAEIFWELQKLDDASKAIENAVKIATHQARIHRQDERWLERLSSNLKTRKKIQDASSPEV